MNTNRPIRPEDEPASPDLIAHTVHNDDVGLFVLRQDRWSAVDERSAAVWPAKHHDRLQLCDGHRVRLHVHRDGPTDRLGSLLSEVPDSRQVANREGPAISGSWIPVLPFEIHRIC